MTFKSSLFFCIPLLLGIAGCGGGLDLSMDGAIVGLEEFPGSLEPPYGLDANSRRIQHLCFASLLSFNSDGSFSNELAESVVMQDETTFVFTLRDNLAFSDGSALAASDVVSAYQEILSPGSASSLKAAYAIIESVEATDSRRVVFKLKEPFAPFFMLATLGISKKLPEEGPRLASGPYEVKEVVENQRIVLQENPRWFGKHPSLERVVLKLVPDESERVLELKRGSIDIIQNDFAPDLLPFLQEDTGLAVSQTPGSSFTYVALNLHNPYLSDIRVRQALNLAIDREKLAKSLYKGMVVPSDSVLPNGHWARHPKIGVPPFDAKKAKALIKEAQEAFPKKGGTIPIKLALKVSSNQAAFRLAEALRSSFFDVGVNVEIQARERGKFFEEVRSGLFDMYVLTWAGVVEPDVYRTLFFSSSVPPVGDNRGFYANPLLDGLLLKARSSYDREVRRELYWRVQEILSQDLPYLHLWHAQNTLVHRRSIEGVKPDALGSFRFLLDAKRSG
jgi:peptide/nickel transport system substrate-binding protein